MARAAIKEQPGAGLAPEAAWLEAAIERGEREPFAEIVTITPALAELLLARNIENRRLSTRQVQGLIASLRAGHWKLNGESLVLARSGELNDGQHRLNAVLASGIAIETVLVFGIDRATRDTLDEGRKRGAEDILHFKGVKNVTTTAAVARMAIGWERTGGSTIRGSSYVTTADIVERVEADPRIAEAAALGAYLYSYGREYATGTVFGFCFYALARIDPVAAETYVTQIATGENLKRTDAVYIVRNAIRIAHTRRAGYTISRILAGWSHFRNGTTPLPSELDGHEPLVTIR